MMTDDELFGPEAQALEETIHDTLYRLRDVREGGAEYRFIIRQLKGLRDTIVGRLIFEEIDMGCSHLGCEGVTTMHRLGRSCAASMWSCVPSAVCQLNRNLRATRQRHVRQGVRGPLT